MYYVSINGEKYEKTLLDLATSHTIDRGEGEISKGDILDLIASVKRGLSITETELKTLHYIRHNFDFTDTARELFDQEMAGL